MINKINSYELIKKSLDVSVARSKVMANNIANINTKNFKRSYVVFEDKLKSLMENDSSDLKVSDEKHIKNNKSDLNYEVQKDESTSIMNNGNNVDIDMEMVNLASNDMMYNFLVDRAKGKLSTKRFIINDGKK